MGGRRRERAVGARRDHQGCGELRDRQPVEGDAAVQGPARRPQQRPVHPRARHRAGERGGGLALLPRQRDGEVGRPRPRRQGRGAGQRQERRQVRRVGAERAAGRDEVGTDQDRAAGGEPQARDRAVRRQGEGLAVRPLGSQVQLGGLLEPRDVGAAEPRPGPRRRERGGAALDPRAAARERQVEGAATGAAPGLGPQGRGRAALPVEGDGEVEGRVPQEGGQQADLAHPDPLEQAEQGRRRRRLQAPGDAAGPVRADLPGQPGAGAGEVGDVEAVDREAGAVRLDPRRDRAGAGARGAEPDVLGLQGQGEVGVAQGAERRPEGRQAGDVEAGGADLGLEPAALGALGGGVAGVAGDPRRPEAQAHVAQGQAGAGGRQVGGGLDLPPVEERDERPLGAEAAEVAAERLRVGGGERHRTGEAQRRRLDLPARRHGGLGRAGHREAAQQQAAGPLQGAGEGEVRPVLAAQNGAAHGEVEVEHRRQAAGRARQAAGDQVLPLRRGQEGVEVEAAGVQGQTGAPLAQVEPSGAAEPQGPAAGVDGEVDGLEPHLRAPGLEGAGQRERQVGAGRLGRRPDDEAGGALGLDLGAAGLGRGEAEPRVRLEARRRVAAARDLGGEAPVRPRRAADRPERDAAARPLDPPGPDQGRRLQAEVLDVELVGPPGGGDLRGDEELLDLQVLDGEVAVAQGSAEIGRQLQRVRAGDRELDLGPADPGLGEAELALQERREGDLGLDEPGIQARAVRIGAEMQAVDAQPRRRQQADLDPAVGPDWNAQGPGERPLDQPAMGLPVDEGRDRERRHENQDDGARQRGQKITQWSRSAPSLREAATSPGRRAPRAPASQSPRP